MEDAGHQGRRQIHLHQRGVFVPQLPGFGVGHPALGTEKAEPLGSGLLQGGIQCQLQPFAEGTVAPQQLHVLLGEVAPHAQQRALAPAALRPGDGCRLVAVDGAQGDPRQGGEGGELEGGAADVAQQAEVEPRLPPAGGDVGPAAARPLRGLGQHGARQGEAAAETGIVENREERPVLPGPLAAVGRRITLAPAFQLLLQGDDPLRRGTGQPGELAPPAVCLEGTEAPAVEGVALGVEEKAPQLGRGEPDEPMEPLDELGAGRRQLLLLHGFRRQPLTA